MAGRRALVVYIKQRPQQRPQQRMDTGITGLGLSRSATSPYSSSRTARSTPCGSSACTWTCGCGRTASRRHQRVDNITHAGGHGRAHPVGQAVGSSSPPASSPSPAHSFSSAPVPVSPFLCLRAGLRDSGAPAGRLSRVRPRRSSREPNQCRQRGKCTNGSSWGFFHGRRPDYLVHACPCNRMLLLLRVYLNRVILTSKVVFLFLFSSFRLQCFT